MGFFDERRAKKEARRALGAEMAAAAKYQRDVAEWRETATVYAQLAAAFTEEPPTDTKGLVLKKGERLVACFDGSLLEARRQRGTYQGGYSGVSFKITKGMRYHVGGSRGTYTPGPEEITAIDDGELAITSTRVVFRGPKQTREWAFAKLLGTEHEWWRNPVLRKVEGATFLQVSNRQKTSGFSYSADEAPLVRFRLELAIARFNDTEADLRDEVQELIDQHAASEPKPPTPAIPASVASTS